MIKRNISEITPIENEDQSMLLFEAIGLTAAIKYAHFSIAMTILKPGSNVKRHFHQESDEIYVIVNGSGVMTVDDDSFHIASGDVVLIVPGERHEVVADGIEDLEFFAITRPAYSPKDFLTD